MTEKTAQQKQIEQRLQNSLKGRRAKERRFVWFGRSAIAVALIFLATLFISIGTKGIPGFFQHYVTLNVSLDAQRLDPLGDMSDQSFLTAKLKSWSMKRYMPNWRQVAAQRKRLPAKFYRTALMSG